jgi:hypothetical protein
MNNDVTILKEILGSRIYIQLTKIFCFVFMNRSKMMEAQKANHEGNNNKKTN